MDNKNILIQRMEDRDTFIKWLKSERKLEPIHPQCLQDFAIEYEVDYHIYESLPGWNCKLTYDPLKIHIQKYGEYQDEALYAAITDFIKEYWLYKDNSIWIMNE